MCVLQQLAIHGQKEPSEESQLNHIYCHVFIKAGRTNSLKGRKHSLRSNHNTKQRRLDYNKHRGDGTLSSANNAVISPSLIHCVQYPALLKSQIHFKTAQL